MITNYLNFFKEHLFLILIPIVIIVGIISYNRLIINQDYIVAYEGVCDPNISNCFIGCEDDSCSIEYYYSKVQKYAPDLYLECGKDITECENANICLPTDRNCNIIYCDSNIEGDACSILNAKSNIENENPDEKILQDNLIIDSNL
jgi:hypothetical protein